MGNGKEPVRSAKGRRLGFKDKPAKVVFFIVEGYIKYISPLRPASCRFYPSCSRYCQEAVKKHGAVKGLAYALIRVLRCHPFSSGGYDPVK